MAALMSGRLGKRSGDYNAPLLGSSPANHPIGSRLRLSLKITFPQKATEARFVTIRG